MKNDLETGEVIATSYDTNEKFAEDDCKPAAINAEMIRIDTYFDPKHSERKKAKLPAGDGKIEYNELVTTEHELKYYIKSVTRNGSKIILDIETDWSQRIGEGMNLYYNEHAENEDRVLSFALFELDGDYNTSVDYPSIGSSMRNPVITIEDVPENAENISIHMTAANFSQYANWTVELPK